MNVAWIVTFCIGISLVTIVTSKEAPCIESYIGDGYCDDDNNNEACQYDGGDCCDNSSPNWNAYCYVSKIGNLLGLVVNRGRNIFTILKDDQKK